MRSKVKLTLGSVSFAAIAVLSALAFQADEALGGPAVSLEAKPTVDYGETVTQSEPPQAPETAVAKPPVKAEPAPTAEPG